VIVRGDGGKAEVLFRPFADPNAESREWRRDFIRTFLERNIPQLGITIPARSLERFWAMLAHYHGQVWNASELARSFGVSHHVTRRYLERCRRPS